MFCFWLKTVNVDLKLKPHTIQLQSILTINNTAFILMIMIILNDRTTVKKKIHMSDVIDKPIYYPISSVLLSRFLKFKQYLMNALGILLL